MKLNSMVSRDLLGKVCHNVHLVSSSFYRKKYFQFFIFQEAPEQTQWINIQSHQRAASCYLTKMHEQMKKIIDCIKNVIFFRQTYWMAFFLYFINVFDKFFLIHRTKTNFSTSFFSVNDAWDIQKTETHLKENSNKNCWRVSSRFRPLKCRVSVVSGVQPIAAS